MKKSPIALRTNLLAAALLATVVSMVVYAVYCVGAIRMFEDMRNGVFDAGEYDAFFARFERIEYLQLGAWLLSALMLAVWMPAALRGGRELGARDTRFRHGWSWALMPIANFWMPYLAMKEIWQTSHLDADRPDHWRLQPVGWLLPTWWAAWLGTYVLQLGLHRNDSETIEGAISLYQLGLAQSVFAILCSGLLYLVVRRVSVAQADRIADPMPSARVVG